MWIVSRPITYIPIHKNKSSIQNNILNFLPKEVVIMSSCNGLLCCWSCIHPIDDIYRRVRNREAKELLVIYICNPMTKEWIALKPEGCVVGDSIGLAFYPFGSSLNTRPIFKLVSIQQSKEDPHLYSFALQCTPHRKVVGQLLKRFAVAYIKFTKTIKFSLVRGSIG